MDTLHSHGCLLAAPVSFMWEVEHRLLMSSHGIHRYSRRQSKANGLLIRHRERVNRYNPINGRV